MANSTSSAASSPSLPAIGFRLESTRLNNNFSTLPLLPAKPVVEIEYSVRAPSAWLVETRSFSGQCGQDSALFSLSGGCGMISSWVTDLAPCRIGGADAVAAGIAAADHDHMLALGADLRPGPLRLARHPPVLLRQKCHRIHQAIELATRRGRKEIERQLGSTRQQQRVVARLELARGQIAADVDVQMKHHAFGLHLLDAPLDDALFHLEVGNAVAQQSTGGRVLVVDVHLVAGTRQLL